MGSCAVKSNQTVIEQPPESEDDNVVRILVSEAEVKCPVCRKPMDSDSEDPEFHLVMCLARPKLLYNEDILENAKGVECAICLEELEENEVIARLPCLCIYHKVCIDEWFKVTRSCPQHPES